MGADVYDFIIGDAALAEHLASILARPAWHRRAARRGLDTDLFVTPRGVKADRAKAVCAHCSVRSECLSFAERGNEVGTWGGRSLQDRTSPTAA